MNAESTMRLTPRPCRSRGVRGGVLFAAAWMAARIATAHVHVQIGYGAQGWELGAYDFDSGAIQADQIVFPVAWQARREIPEDARYTAFLGASGGMVWVLPEVEAEGVLYLGVGTSRIGSGVFSADLVRLRLHSVEGPGRFAVYSVGALGAPIVHMNTADGIQPDRDLLSVPAVGGHRHVNWAFGAAGRYRVGFVASGQLRTGSTVVESEVVHFTFDVIAPPPPRLIGPRSQPEGRWFLGVEAAPGMRCRILRSTDLIHWQVVGDRILPVDPWIIEVPPDAGLEGGVFWKAEVP